MRHHIVGFLLVLGALLPSVVEGEGTAPDVDFRALGQLGEMLQESFGSGDVDFDLLKSMYVSGELEYARIYKNGKIRAVADNTGILMTYDSSGRAEGCTATLISEQLILTNDHCVPLEGPDRVTSAAFFLGYETGDATSLPASGVPRYNVILPAIEQQAQLDYAILQLSAPVMNYTKLEVTVIRDPDPAEALKVVGFPGGYPLSSSPKNCIADEAPVRQDVIYHRCGGFPGSSGSLIFTDGWALVGLHSKGDTRLVDGEIERSGEGIRFVALMTASPTLNRLFTPEGNAAPLPPPLSPAELEDLLGLTGDSMREVQGRLSALQYDVGGVDGSFGPATRRAIKRWQSAAGVAVTGYLDQAQIQELRNMSAKAYAAWISDQTALAAVQATTRSPANVDAGNDNQPVKSRSTPSLGNVGAASPDGKSYIDFNGCVRNERGQVLPGQGC